MNPETLSFQSLATRCACEIERFRAGQPNDPSFCFEMWRRAIEQKSEQAWKFLFVHYTPQVRAWVVRDPGFADTGEEVDEFVSGALLQILTYLTPATFELLRDLGAVLEYLKMCVATVIINCHRRKRKDPPGMVELDDPESHELPAPDPINELLKSMEQDQLWGWLNTRLKTEQERVAIECKYAIGLRPREIAARFPEVFCNVSEVYKVLANALERLRRDPGRYDLCA